MMTFKSLFEDKARLPSIVSQVFDSHEAICLLLLACLALPSEVLYANAIFVACGLLWIPFTTAWWALFISALVNSFVSGHHYPLFEGMVCCCGITMAVGWYSTQVAIPYAFGACMNVWVLEPLHKHGPRWLFSRLPSNTNVMFRVVDVLCVHAVPVVLALYLFGSNMSSSAVLASFPANLVWLVATGANKLEDTNQIYGVRPEPPQWYWKLLYFEHALSCALMWYVLLWRDTLNRLKTDI